MSRKTLQLRSPARSHCRKYCLVLGVLPHVLNDVGMARVVICFLWEPENEMSTYFNKNQFKGTTKKHGVFRA